MLFEEAIRYCEKHTEHVTVLSIECKSYEVTAVIEFLLLRVAAEH
jgi:hypothetical protein